MANGKPENLRELIEQGYAYPALLPEKNDYILSEEGRKYRKNLKEEDKLDSTLRERLFLINLDRLDSLVGYTVPLISHDYGAKTPLMWNALYEKLGLKIRNIMLVADPENAEFIFNTFRNDPKYLGGGLGVGFKEKGRYLDRVVPADLKAANIVVKDGKELVGYNTDAQGFISSLEDKFREIGKIVEGSNIIIFGAGGVAKEVARLIASKKASRITILNRTYSKAVSLAYELNEKYGQIALGAGEEIIRGYLLNSFMPPDAAINLTDKGSDGPLEEYSAFAAAEKGGYNQNISRTIARELKRLNPKIIIADIVLPKKGRSITLRIAENEGLENLLDGVPMVINQAAPAYRLVQDANPELHVKKVSEEEALEVFRKATKLKQNKP